MALVFGDLGQASPAAGTLVDLYVCPAGKRATVKLGVANRGAATTFRAAVAPGGAADAVTHYKAYDDALAANEALSSDKMTLAAGDVVRVRSASGDVTFTINGYEEDA